MVSAQCAASIVMSNVSYAYPNGQKALEDISFTLQAGERVALVGGNSAGKSTLLMHCNGCLLAQHGQVTIQGQPITAANLTQVRENIGSIFQDADDQLFMPTLAEDVAFGPQNMGLSDTDVAARVAEALEMTGCTHLKSRQPQHLSGGEKRAAAIATVLAMHPDILLMDEPTANLDPYARRQFIRLLHSLPHTFLLATHDLDLVLELCPRTIILHQGRIIADGNTRVLFADTDLLTSCRLEQPLSMLLPHNADYAV